MNTPNEPQRFEDHPAYRAHMLAWAKRQEPSFKRWWKEVEERLWALPERPEKRG